MLNEQILEGEVDRPLIIQRYFKTLQALTDFVLLFNLTNGGFAHGDYPGVGRCYLLEYPPVNS